MAVTPIPDAPVVPQYPALGSATFNQEAYAYGTAMPGVTWRIHEIALASKANAEEAGTQAQLAIAQAQLATTQVGLATTQANAASAAATRAESARDRAVQAEAVVEQALIDGPVLQVNGQTGLVVLSAADVGAVAKTGGTATGIKYTVVGLGSISGETEIDFAVAQEFVATVTDDVVFTIANPPASGETQIIYLRLTDAGSFALNWPSNTRFDSSEPLMLTAGGEDLLGVKYDGGVLSVYVIGLNVGVPV